ncbi:MAG: hypothetical protein EPN41_05495 [Candidimonas sp.]|nr:MAG: hypothetical protein EPN41_05495 [Candidimonas sp.]
MKARYDAGRCMSKAAFNRMTWLVVDTVRLLLAMVPAVFANDIFAMKGGTIINLSVRDVPRLSITKNETPMDSKTA